MKIAFIFIVKDGEKYLEKVWNSSLPTRCF